MFMTRIAIFSQRDKLLAICGIVSQGRGISRMYLNSARVPPEIDKTDKGVPRFTYGGILSNKQLEGINLPHTNTLTLMRRQKQP